jgi:hypothetical protein
VARRLEQAGGAAPTVARGSPAGTVEPELLEQLAPLQVRQLADAVAVEMEQVEDHVVDRLLLDPGLDHHRRSESHAALEQLEARPAVRIERDDLAVQDRGVIRERLADRGELRVAGADVLEPAAEHGPPAEVGVSEDSNSVPLDLVGPVVRIGLGQVPVLGQHGLEPARHLLARGGVQDRCRLGVRHGIRLCGSFDMGAG